MKHIYTKTSRTWTKHGVKVARNVETRVGKLVRGYLKRGYDPIELEHLLVHSVTFAVTMEKLKRAAARALDTKK